MGGGRSGRAEGERSCREARGVTAPQPHLVTSIPLLSPLCSLYSISVHSAVWTCTGWRQPSTPLWPAWRTSSRSSSWMERYQPGLTPMPRWGSCVLGVAEGRRKEVCDGFSVLYCAGDVCAAGGPTQCHIPEGSGGGGSLPTEDQGAWTCVESYCPTNLPFPLILVILFHTHFPSPPLP